jgi:alkanesulfonate monooxygenase SsuD/methylene tetrahydromethanopterin reductase-like flavin-dependent oxidoreductase (luciferase family)
LWPLKPKTPYGGTPDGSLPIQYQNVLDPLETLSYLAGNTDQISLGTCLIDMLFHNPVVLAKRFATLDVLSDGRAIAGLGIGWSKDEYEVSGIPHKYRAYNIWICFFPTRPGYEEDGGDNKAGC